MKREWQTLLAVLCGLAVFAVLQRLADTTLPGGAALVLRLQSERPCTVTVHWSHEAGRFTRQQSVTSSPVKAGSPAESKIYLHDTSLHSVRLDFDVSEVRLFALRVASHLAPGNNYSPEDILRLFQPLDETTRMEASDDGGVRLVSSGTAAALVSTAPLLRANVFMRWLLPAFLALVVFRAVQCADWGRFAPFADIEGKQPSGGGNIAALDGLRGLAAVMVVADHTMPSFLGVGAAGVLVFFALSGFLLARPFVLHPDRMLSLHGLYEYAARRISRVLPIYYVYIFVIYCLTQRYNLAIRHLLFVEGAGHLWAIPQEMLFYLLFIPLQWCIAIVCRGRAMIVIPALGALMLLWNGYVDQNVLPMYGMDHKALRPMAGVFLAGVLCAWVCHGTSLSRYAEENQAKVGVWLLSLLGLSLLGVEIFFANGGLLGSKAVYAQQYFGWYGFAAAVAVACAAMVPPGSPLDRVLRWKPLRALGVVSLSLYLFHPQVMQLLRSFVPQYFGATVTPGAAFVGTMIGSYLVACVTYSLVERPFIVRMRGVSTAGAAAGAP